MRAFLIGFHQSTWLKKLIEIQLILICLCLVIPCFAWPSGGLALHTWILSWRAPLPWHTQGARMWLMVYEKGVVWAVYLNTPLYCVESCTCHISLPFSFPSLTMFCTSGSVVYSFAIQHWRLKQHYRNHCPIYAANKMSHCWHWSEKH